MAAFIEDGYTTEGYLSEEPGRHEAVNFTYRPATAREVTIWRNGRDRDPEKSDAEFLAKHLVKWDIKASGKEVEISISNCQKLHPAVADGMHNIISGYTRSGEPSPSADMGN